MLDINYIRDHKKKVAEACKNKGLDSGVVGDLLAIDEKRRDLMGTVQVLRTQRNALNLELKGGRTDALLKKASEQKKRCKN